MNNIQKCNLVASIFLVASLSGVPTKAWDPIRDITGKRLDEHAQSLANSLDKARHNPVKYVGRRTRELAEDLCSAPARIYAGSAAASGGRLMALPQNFIYAVQRFYSVDLRNVRYREHANVFGRAVAVTDKGQIYIEHGINWSNPGNVRLMLHELEHVVQYAQRGHGRSRLQCEYTLKSIGTLGQHGDIDMERAADRKANFVMSQIFPRYAPNYRPMRQYSGRNSMSRGQPSYPRRYYRRR